MTITLLLSEPTQSLPINVGPGLTLLSAEVMGAAASWEESTSEVTVLRLGQEAVGEVTVNARFGRTLALDDIGFYLCEYKGDLMATTHFKPHYARCAFPCFDEPHLRAVFSLQLTVQPDTYQCISNMPLVHHAGGTFRFLDTPRISTYLLYWSVCNHQSARTSSKSGVPIAIHNRRLKHVGTYLTLAQEVCDFCEDYFRLPCPMPKLDIVAAYSNSHSATRGRATEAWGVMAVLGRHIEYRRSDIAAALSRNSRTLCHEIVHMWVGNLATISWWTSFWLIESLTRFVEHKILMTLRPHFRIWQKYQKDILLPALDIDGSDASKALEIECNDPEQLDTIYDAAAYGRGMALIAMLEELVGADNFQQGLSDFLQTYSFRNFDSSQFFSFFAKYCPEVLDVFQPWVYETGFPLLLISRTDSGIRVQQRRFLNVMQMQKPADEELWSIPLTYLSSHNPQVQKTLVREQCVDVGLGPEVKWFACNLNRVCYLRVKYSDDLLLALAEPIREQVLSAVDIFGILNDHFLYFRSGGTKYSTLKTLLLASSWCRELILCEEWLDILRFLWRFLAGRHLFRREVQTLARDLFRGCLNPPTDCIHRDSIIGLALRTMVRICDDEQTKEAVRTTFETARRSLSSELYQIYAELYFHFNPLEKVLSVVGSDMRLQYTAAQTGNEEVLLHYFSQFITGRLNGLRFSHIDPFLMLRVMLQLLVECSQAPDKWQQVKQSSFSNACVDAVSRWMSNIHARDELDKLLVHFEALTLVHQRMHENWLSALINCKTKLAASYAAHQRNIDPIQREILHQILD